MNVRDIHAKKKGLRCKLILDLIVPRACRTGSTFLHKAQFIKWQALKTCRFSLCTFCRASYLGVRLFHFGDQRRMTQVNHAPQPSGSFIQDVPRSFLGIEAVNNLKTFHTGLKALRLWHPGNGEDGAAFNLGS